MTDSDSDEDRAPDRASRRLPSVDPRAHTHPAISQAVGIALAHFTDPDEVRTSRVAQRVGLSTAYFSRLFRRLAGITFRGYVTALRVGRALELIAERPHASLSQVAHDSGFKSVQTFQARFERLIGSTPAEYASEMRRWAEGERHRR